MEVGLRVVRGKDWKWGDQDGGEGSVGTIVEIGGQGSKNPKNTAVVVWDCGVKANYRAGHHGADDLKVLDNASAGVRHLCVNCDICNESGIIGTRWNCEVCHDFDLCHSCYMGGKHDLVHTFTRMDTPLSCGVKVQARTSSRRIQAKGIYPNAKVVRGLNWAYKNQDGGDGKQGVVQTIGDSSTEGLSWRSWVKVKWDVGTTNDYRRGHEGKIDVKCITATKGEWYYVDHLACLCDYATCSYKTGERVKLNLNKLSASEKDNMSKFIGKIGKIIVSEDSQQVFVQFPNFDKAFRLPTSYLLKVQYFSKGDTVLISNDRDSVINLQNGHGGWNDQMTSCLGVEAKVLGTDSDGDIKVEVNGKKWILNPDCLTLLCKGSDGDSDESDENNEDDDTKGQEDIMSNFGANFLDAFLKAMIEGASEQRLSPDQLVKMAADGNVDAVRSILRNHPTQVDIKVKDMTPLQVAAHQGHQQVVTVLLSAGASIDEEDSNGDNALHFATIGGKSAVLELLAKQKPGLVNATNNQQRTCLHLAVMHQFPLCLQVLLRNNVNINSQDKDGDTSLHIALIKPDVSIQDLLVSQPTLDVKLKNGKGFNIIHMATLKNNVNALRKLIQKAPIFVNVAKADGFTALHIASINGFKEAGEMLINLGKANMEMKNGQDMTPLLLAVNQGRASMIELLVNKGADVNAEDRDGDTCLHLSVSQLKILRQPGADLFAFAIFNVMMDGKQPKDMKDAPAISKICNHLSSSVQSHNRAWMAICCFLLQNGANLYKENHSGKSVGNMIGDDLKELFKRYAKAPTQAPRQEESPIQVASAKATSASPPAALDGNGRTCMMCLSKMADITFYPCEHKVVCSECSRKMKCCFSCHEKIQEKIRNQAIKTTQVDMRKSTSPASNNVPTAEEVRRSRMTQDAVSCPLCETRARNVVFLCGHSCCKECSSPLNSCHVCGQSIVQRITLM